MELLLAPLLLIAVVLYVAWPLLQEDATAPSVVVVNAQLEAARTEKDNLLESMKDLEMDLRMGKLSKQDHADLSEQLEARAVRALQELEALEDNAAGESSGQ